MELDPESDGYYYNGESKVDWPTDDEVKQQSDVTVSLPEWDVKASLPNRCTFCTSPMVGAHARFAIAWCEACSKVAESHLRIHGA